MHAASRDVWRALKACSSDFCEITTNQLRAPLATYLITYAWGLNKSELPTLDKYCRLLLHLEYGHMPKVRDLVAELAPEATVAIDGYDEWWRAELAGEHKSAQ